jgi:thiosulfate sulfurtransferase
VTIIYCYKGISSQDAAHYLSSQGFKDVYSVDGGFEEWKK